MAEFDIALNLTLAHEGGFQDMPNDAGNWTGGKTGVGELKGTKYGISSAEFPTLDVANLTLTQAAQIYRERYWSPLYDSIKDQHIGNKLFDMGVLFGIPKAVEFLQSVLGIRVDGSFGPETLEAVNGEEPLSLLAAYKTILINHVLQENSEFGTMWIRRINS